MALCLKFCCNWIFVIHFLQNGIPSYQKLFSVLTKNGNADIHMIVEFVNDHVGLLTQNSENRTKVKRLQNVFV